MSISARKAGIFLSLSAGALSLAMSATGFYRVCRAEGEMHDRLLDASSSEVTATSQGFNMPYDEEFQKAKQQYDNGGLLMFVGALGMTALAISETSIEFSGPRTRDRPKFMGLSIS